MMEHGPIKILLSEVLLTVFLDAVADAHIYAIRCEYPVDLAEHLVCAGPWAIATKNGVKRAFVDDAVEAPVLEREAAAVHVLVDQSRVLVLVILLHLFDDGVWDVDVRDFVVAIVCHLFTQACQKS